MSFLNPTYLWCFLGLLLPLLIHLWSKKQHTTIKVGSTQFIEPTSSNRASSIQLNEWILLLLRLLLIGGVTLLVSGMQLHKIPSQKSIAYFVDPSLQSLPEVQKLIDSLQKKEVVFSFKKGFPKVKSNYQEDSISKNIFHWQLARDLEHFPADSLVVFTRAYLKNTRGKRPKLSRDIKWVKIDENIQSTFKPIAAKQSDKGTTIYRVKSNATTTLFNKEFLENNTAINTNGTGDSILTTGSYEKVLITPTKKLKIGLKVDDSFKNQKSYLTASLAVVSEYINTTAVIENINTDGEIENLDILFWISTEPSPATEATLVYYQPDQFADDLLIKENKKKYRLTALLHAENSIRQHLMDALVTLLGPSQEILKTAENDDQRTIAPEELRTNYSVKKKIISEVQKFDMNSYLWIVLLVLLVSERVLAKKRVQ
ncbi:BatA domain-containing protein [Aquimarina sp. ERC-38]|uniref:BatA domain-containing protein n=1 Tax=Aquimarina sp. ERC-38 TaxID=2949996 RepID=UPI00224528D9|nr:BatA domain-containing protein [Aquimarina sp. ERC-38]UZO80720.1 BatA domain-containing protein [Aquimarina sp. ERC-38]